MLTINPILNADSYKMSHFAYYPEGTTEVYSYMESRGGRYPETLFFGLQGYIKEYLQAKYGDLAVEQGGYKVITTLDWEKQQVADAHARRV